MLITSQNIIRVVGFIYVSALYIEWVFKITFKLLISQSNSHNHSSSFKCISHKSFELTEMQFIQLNTPSIPVCDWQLIQKP